MYAHVTGTTVDTIGQPPRLVLQDDQWIDLRTLDPELLASAGWYPLTLTTRPADTASTTTDMSYVYADGKVTQVWTERPKTAAEIDAANAESNRTQIEAKAAQALSANATFLAIASPTNAQTLAQVKMLTRECTAIIRLLLSRLETTDGT